MATTMDFPAAMAAVNAGKTVSRLAWTSTDPANIPRISRDPGGQVHTITKGPDEGKTIVAPPTIVYATAVVRFTWTPGPSDMVATDYVVLA
jgi:hypothetical protein